jgi:transposase-like protein
MRDVKAFKREAVDRVRSSGLSAGAVARELGLHETVLRRWMMQFGAHCDRHRCSHTTLNYSAACLGV